MSTVIYRLYLEGVVPESDEARVRGFLERIFGEEIARLPYGDLFPREVPGQFTFQRASEWMEALGRAGVRTRVEVDAHVGAHDHEILTPETLGDGSTLQPLQIWWGLLRQPERTWQRLRAIAPGQLLVLGVLFVVAGEVLAWPGELVLARRIGGEWIQAGTAGHLLLTWLVLTPIARLLGQAVLLWLMLRLLGHAAGFTEVLLLAGLANAGSPLQVVPILGSFAAAVLWIWLAATGVAVWYDLSRARTVAVALSPVVLTVLPFVLLLASALGALAISGPVWIHQLETMPWPD